MSSDALKPMKSNARRTTFICGALLLVSAVLSYSAALTESSTIDEPIHSLGGYMSRWMDDYRVDIENPPLFHLITTLPQQSSDLKVNPQDPALRAILDNYDNEWSLAVRTMF